MPCSSPSPHLTSLSAFTPKSVGYHSDVLTYLGPYPTIASLSLGVSRPFRLRPFLPSSSSSNPAKTTNRTLEIPLTHNTLCIMHAGCQERFKHSVPPVSAMDLFRLPGERGKGDKAGRGYRERINVSSVFLVPQQLSVLLLSVVGRGREKGVTRSERRADCTFD